MAGLLLYLWRAIDSLHFNFLLNKFRNIRFRGIFLDNILLDIPRNEEVFRISLNANTGKREYTYSIACFILTSIKYKSRSAKCHSIHWEKIIRWTCLRCLVKRCYTVNKCQNNWWEKVGQLPLLGQRVLVVSQLSVDYKIVNMYSVDWSVDKLFLFYLKSLNKKVLSLSKPKLRSHHLWNMRKVPDHTYRQPIVL